MKLKSELNPRTKLLLDFSDNKLQFPELVEGHGTILQNSFYIIIKNSLKVGGCQNG